MKKNKINFGNHIGETIKQKKLSEERSKFFRMDGGVHSVIPLNENHYWVYNRRSKIIKIFGIAFYVSLLKRKHKNNLTEKDIKEKKYLYLKNYTIMY